MGTHYDVVVVGAGTAGLAAWREATARGKTVALVDPGPLGTTCARVGCMPSKLLIAAAHAARDARRAHRFGADIEREPVIDGEAVMARVRSERDRFVRLTLPAYDAVPDAHFYRQPGRFQQDGSLAVGDDVLTADAFVLAVGSRARQLKHLREHGATPIESDDVFEWTDLPKKVAVIGPGVIGLELGSALAHLGVDVSAFGKGNLIGPLSDPAIKKAAADIFSSHVRLDLSCDLRTLVPKGDCLQLTWEGDSGLVTETFDAVIETVGRIPNTDTLGLDAMGITELDDVDPHTLRLGETNLFIVGDASKGRPLLHEAVDEGRIAGMNAATFPNVNPATRRSPLAILFTGPDIAIVGDAFNDLDADDVVTGEASYDDQGRARCFLRNEGLLHVYIRKSDGRLLGAEMVAPDGEHLAHLLAWAHQQELTLAELLMMPFYHPTVEEGLRTALRDAQTKLERPEQTVLAQEPA